MQPGVLHPDVTAGQVGAAAVEQRPHHLHELAGPGVPLVLRQVVAVRPLLDRVAAGDHVQRDPVAEEAPEGVGLLGDQRRLGETGPERHQEADPLRHRRDRRGQHPRVHAAESHGRQQLGETGLFGRAGHLCQIAEVGAAAGRGGGAALDGGDPAGIAAVTAGGQEPVQYGGGGRGHAGVPRRKCGRGRTYGTPAGRGKGGRRNGSPGPGASNAAEPAGGGGPPGREGSEESREGLSDGPRGTSGRPDTASPRHAEDPRGDGRRGRGPWAHPRRAGAPLTSLVRHADRGVSVAGIPLLRPGAPVGDPQHQGGDVPRVVLAPVVAPPGQSRDLQGLRHAGTPGEPVRLGEDRLRVGVAPPDGTACRWPGTGGRTACGRTRPSSPRAASPPRTRWRGADRRRRSPDRCRPPPASGRSVRCRTR